MARDTAELFKNLDAIIAIRPKELALRPDLGSLNFSAIIPSIEAAQAFAISAKTLNYEFIPKGRYKTFNVIARDLLKTFEPINAFQITDPNAPQKRDEIQSQIENKINEMLEVGSQIAGMGILGSADYSKRERELSQTLEGMLNQISDASKKAQEGLSAIQNAAAKAGVSKEATHFAEQAKEHEDASAKWLKATVALVIIMIVWGGVALWYLTLTKDASTAEIVQAAIGKLIILSGLYYGLVWCARNYRASLHNYVVNKHRQNSLTTFETFVQAAGKDEAIKNAILLQATTSIFSSQASGYTQTDPDPDQPSKIIEITKLATGKTSP